MTLLEYYHALRAHDWFFHFSDDPHVSRKGEESHRALIKWAFHTSEHTRLINEWHAYKLGQSGKRPELPTASNEKEK